MAASLSTLEAALKESYAGPIQNQLNNACELATQLGEAEATIDASGKFAIVPFKLGRNTGVGARGAGGVLPTAGNQRMDKLTLQYKFIYGRFGFDGPALAAAKKGVGAFGSVAEIEMDGLGDDVKKYTNLVAFLGGSVIGFIWEKDNNATKDFSGRMSAPVGGANQVQLVLMRTGQLFGAATGLTALTAGATVDVMTLAAAINTSIGQVDAGGNAVVAGDVFAVVHNSADLAVEPTGHLGNMAIRDYHGISRATESVIRSTFRTVANGDVSAALADFDDMDFVGNQCATLSGQEITQYWFNRNQKQAYTSLLQGTAAANLFIDVKAGSDKPVDGGFSGALNHNGVPLKMDVDCPRGTILAINHKKWKKVVLREGGFDEDYGQMLRPTPNQDGVEGVWKAYYEIFCQQPNGAGAVVGVIL